MLYPTAVVSLFEQPERKELGKVRSANASDGVPARLRREPCRAAAGVRPVSDVVERLLKRG